MIDVVYVLWSESKYQNREIRYSIRSVWKHGRNLGQLCIVGMKVDRLNSYVSVPYDPAYKCKDVNIFGAMLAASRDSRISDPFLFFNDDYFMLQDFNAEDLPAWYGTPSFKQEIYEKIYRETLSVLRNRGIENPKFYDLHLPILVHKQCMIDACPKSWERIRFFSNTMYANQCPALLPEETEDVKIRNTCDLPDDARAFSTTDYVDPNVWEFLQARFPDPSPFEIRR